MITETNFNMYLSRRGVARDGDGYRCTTCNTMLNPQRKFNWHRCPNGCSDWLDAHGPSATAARVLNANVPPEFSHPEEQRPTVEAVAPAATPRPRGRPKGSGDFTAQAIFRAARLVWAEGGRRPTRREVAEFLSTTVETVDATLRREGLTFSDVIRQLDEE